MNVARQVERSRPARLLRAEVLTPADRATGLILSATADAGTGRLGGTIAGTKAFRLYEGELGIRLTWGGIASGGSASDRGDGRDRPYDLRRALVTAIDVGPRPEGA